MDTKKAIGTRINAALACRGMKQKELAAKIGVSDNVISYYCSGTRTPSILQLSVIADTLNVSTDYLLGRTEVMVPEETIQAISNATGLSENNINMLKSIQNSAKTDIMYRQIPFFLNDLLSAFAEDETLRHCFNILLATDIPSRKKDEDGNYIFDMEIAAVSHSFGYCQIPGKDAFDFYCWKVSEAVRQIFISQYKSKSKWYSQEGENGHD